MSRAARVLAAGVLCAGIARAAAAQAPGRRLLTGVEYRSVSFTNSADSTKRVSEFVVPAGIVYAPSERFSIDLGTRFASATRESGNGGSTTVSGLTDTQARLVYALRPDQLVLSLAANLPTGKATIEGNELAVIGAIADKLIPYPVSNFGSGFSLTTGLAFALPVGGWAIGASGSFRFNGTYTLFADTSAAQSQYKPGAETRIRVGADRVVGQGRVSLGVTYSNFSIDEYNGSQAFQPGQRYISQASWAFPFMGSSLSLYAWDLYRSAGTDFAGATATRRETQNTMAFGAAAGLGARGRLRPSLEFRSQSEGASSGSLLSAGMRYTLQLGDRLTLLPAFRYDTGSITAGSKATFSGLSASVSIRSSW